MSDAAPKDYVLTIRVPIRTMDDVEARRMARLWMGQFAKDAPGSTLLATDCKLQEVFGDKPPRKVTL